MRIRLRPIHFLIAWIGVLGLGLLLLSGAIPIQASSGHWRVTAWMLDLIKRRSVHTYSRPIVAPPLDRPAWIARGAAHFESGCRQCHGSPLSPRPPLVMRMTPHPPMLSERIARWDERELFQIVKHGIKFTAMPAWMAPQRADEIWAVVSFLRVMPSLTPDAYRRLAFGDTTTADGVSAIERCARCHGSDGLGRDGAFPVLAGQRPDYMNRALLAYRDGTRHSGIMRPEAAELDDRTRAMVVAHFSGLRRPPETPASTNSLIYTGAAGRQIPPCVQCHGPDGADRNPAYPVLAGQDASYLFEQLVLFKENRRGGSSLAPVMKAIADRLSPADMRAAADAFAAMR